MQTSRTAPRTDVVALVSTILTALLILMLQTTDASAQIKLGGTLKSAVSGVLR